MPFTSKDYRSHLYENRSHPEEKTVNHKGAPTFSFWVFSAIPFLIVEYFFQSEFKRLPSGLMFPAGFLFFWGLYQSLLISENKIPRLKVLPKKPRPRIVPPLTEKVFSEAAPASKPKDFLPEKILQNLSVLGLKPTRDWNVIHKRYRELAKQYHPDLNPDFTTKGTRFMIYDSAYRNLLKVKKEYFK